MREWLNAILQFIGSESLTDQEYDSINFLELEINVYNQAAYDELAKVVNNRETMSTALTRLGGFFTAKGLEVSPASTSKTNVVMGFVL